MNYMFDDYQANLVIYMPISNYFMNSSFYELVMLTSITHKHRVSITISTPKTIKVKREFNENQYNMYFLLLHFD